MSVDFIACTALHAFPVNYTYLRSYREKFRGSQLAHENKKYFTPQKLPAIR